MLSRCSVDVHTSLSLVVVSLIRLTALGASHCLRTPFVPVAALLKENPRIWPHPNTSVSETDVGAYGILLLS